LVGWLVGWLCRAAKFCVLHQCAISCCNIHAVSVLSAVRMEAINLEVLIVVLFTVVQ
jgi:hypothetical protein